jgi:uncharacterized protein YcfJ
MPAVADGATRGARRQHLKIPFDTRLAGVLATALTLTGCVGPMAPSAELVPPPTSPGVVSADATCRQYADAQIAPLRDQANAQSVGSTLLGAGLGAALGGAIGGGRGAGIGAASGAVLGTGVGAANAQNAAMNLQQQYNIYYANCMSAHGGAAPGGYSQPPGAYSQAPGGYSGAYQPPPGAYQPPPGYPPR